MKRTEERGNRGTGLTRRFRFRKRWRAAIILVFWFFPFRPFPCSPVHPSYFARSSRNDLESISTATSEGRLAVFDDLWQTINDRYYDPAFHGVDWNAQRTVYRPQAAKAATAEAFYYVLHQIIGSLNDAHTRVYPPEAKFDWWNPRFVGVGLTLREIEGQPTVVKVERDSAAAHKGIRPGDVIESVNGASALSLIRQRFSNEAWTTSRPARRHVFATLMEGAAETGVEVRWQDHDGQTRSAEFQRHWYQHHLGLRIRREPKKYALVEIDAFTRPIALEFARAFEAKLESAHGIIIDLRENGGGDAEAMAEIASFFLAEGISLGHFTDRWGSDLKIVTRSKSLFGPYLIAQTKLPLIVLTSDRTSSAAEIFASRLKSLKRARVVGEETCGCVLAIRARHILPDGGALDVSELDYQTPEGLRLEGNGLKPDQLVQRRRDDLYANQDRALEAALKLLAKPTTDY